MRFTEEQNQYILDIYKDSCATPRIAVELFEQRYNFKITVCTIRTKWRESRLELQTQGGYRNKSRRKSNSPLYNLPKNPDIKYLRIRAKQFN